MIQGEREGNREQAHGSESAQSREQLIRQVVGREWELFVQVNNEGGRASCQEDPNTFSVMRGSQFVIWPGEALLSWLHDLEQAEAAGHNLLAEKYGYMMAETAPESYEKIRNGLLPVSEEKRRLAEELVQQEIRWREEFQKLSPRYAAFGRPIRKEQAAPGETSLETYARGELLTYSMETLGLLKAHWQQMAARGENGAALVLDEEARRCGYGSAAEVEQLLAGQKA